MLLAFLRLPTPQQELLIQRELLRATYPNNTRIIRIFDGAHPQLWAAVATLTTELGVATTGGGAVLNTIGPVFLGRFFRYLERCA